MPSVIAKITYTSPTGELKRRPETTLLKESIEAARRLAAAH
jgi:hypothetical protein